MHVWTQRLTFKILGDITQVDMAVSHVVVEPALGLQVVFDDAVNGILVHMGEEGDLPRGSRIDGWNVDFRLVNSDERR